MAAVTRIVNRNDIEPQADACGNVQELYASDMISLAYSVMTDGSTPHKHRKMEEVYFIVKGRAKIQVEDELFAIRAGDVVSIPKNAYHSIQDVEEAIELIVVTSPAFDPDDVLY